jgi:hypothetical protein
MKKLLILALGVCFMSCKHQSGDDFVGKWGNSILPLKITKVGDLYQVEKFGAEKYWQGMYEYKNGCLVMVENPFVKTYIYLEGDNAIHVKNYHDDFIISGKLTNMSDGIPKREQTEINIESRERLMQNPNMTDEMIDSSIGSFK